MSAKSKGTQYEKEVEKILQAEGWITERARPLYSFIGPGKIISQRHDFFTLWDLLAVRSGLPMRCVQVTVWENVSSKIKFFNEQKEKLAAFQTQFYEPCLYLRMRGRNPHFRIIYLRYEWKWKGDTAMVVKP